ncbi:hypothetical protein [Xenophilus azovorans]|nr:hypothetical protein [Xenophilus azovorans]
MALIAIIVTALFDCTSHPLKLLCAFHPRLHVRLRLTIKIRGRLR